MTKRNTQTVYLNEKVQAEAMAEAARLGRSTAWVIGYAWRLSRKEVAALPADPPLDPEENE